MAKPLASTLDDDPLSTAWLRYVVRPPAVSAAPGPEQTRPFGLRFARALRRFAATLPGGVVHKSFGPNTITEGGQLKVAYTRMLQSGDLEDLQCVGSTALQAQAWVNKACDARVVVVGEQMFTILIEAGSAAAHRDWRADFDALTYRLINTPADVAAGARVYLKTLGLVYAALDFGVESDTGRFVFYESNSAGQYGWLEAQTGAQITSALADLLAGACA